MIHEPPAPWLLHCHLHPVGHCMKCDEISGRRSFHSLSLTPCWSWYEIRSDCLVENHVSLTACWSWDEMRLPGSKSLYCHSHPDHGCGMRWDDTAWLTMPLSLTLCSMVMGWDLMKLSGLGCHSLAVGHGMRSGETSWQKIMVLALTYYWSWDEILWDCLAEHHCHSLAVRWHEINCDTKLLYCCSHSVHGIRGDEIA